MKCVIMAAGRGKRMLDLTKEIPKPLVSVNKKPFLYYMLTNLQRLGFNEIGIIVHYKKERIERFLKDFQLKATLIEQGEPLGTGHAILASRDFVKNEDFIVLNGDDYYSDENILLLRKIDEFCYVLGYSLDNPVGYGILIEKNGFLQKIIEKPKTFVGNIVNTGAYKFTHEIFHALAGVAKSVRGEYELTDALSILAGEKKVKVVESVSGWKSLNKPEDILGMEKYLVS
jgi:dTDP-glucose pyrophosphorylase